MTAVALAAACGGGSSADPPHATVPTAPLFPTTTDPYAVPATIDAAYVNRVLAGLDAVIGDALRLIVRTREIPSEVRDRLSAVYADPDTVDFVLADFQDRLRAGMAGLRDQPGNERSTVIDLISASPQCVFARVSRDKSALTVAQGYPPDVEWVGLVSGQHEALSRIYNPTPWKVAAEGVRANGEPIASPCRSD